MKKAIQTILAEHKGKLLASSLVTLLPALAGRWMMWESLALLAAHWLVLLVVFSDRRNREGQSRKAVGLVFWVMPFTSLLTGGAAALLAREADGAGAFSAAMALGFGALLVAVGNYMPKFRQNSFIGIRVPWTLASEANWNATHRFGGKVWVAGGFACMAGALLPAQAMGVVFPAVLAAAALLPIGYAWRYSKIHPQDVKAPAAPVPPAQKRAAWLLAAAVAVAAVWTLLMGGAEMQYGETSFTVAASGWEDLTVPYADIAAVDYLPAGEAPDGGIRTYGLGNLRVSFGQFSNDAYGPYTRYTYRSCPDCVRLTTTDGATILLNAPDQPATRALYEELAAKTGKTG